VADENRHPERILGDIGKAIAIIVAVLIVFACMGLIAGVIAKNGLIGTS
jgi:Fe2+ transport system protein B